MAKMLPEWLGDQQWEKRSAALICLAQVAEGCVKVWVLGMGFRANVALQVFETRVLEGVTEHVVARDVACERLPRSCP